MSRECDQRHYDCYPFFRSLRGLNSGTVGTTHCGSFCDIRNRLSGLCSAANCGFDRRLLLPGFITHQILSFLFGTGGI